MKLRVDHRARERNHAPPVAICASSDNATARPLFYGCGYPLSARVRRALAKLRSRELHDAALGQADAIDLPNAAAAYKEDPVPSGMNRRRKRVDRRSIGELANAAAGECGLE